jgi:cytochrome oxidase Cu insertion factor (SCO1/SenC/PrrC family)
MSGAGGAGAPRAVSALDVPANGARRGRRALALLAVLTVLGGAVGAGTHAQAQGSLDIDELLRDLQLVPLDGEPPPFTLADLEGKPRALASLKGRVVLLYFWATW